MESSVVVLFAMLLGMTLQTYSEHTEYREFHEPKNRPGKRNTKFLIPVLISHMYRQKLDDSPLSTMLNRPFGKTAGKQDKRDSKDGLEHRTIVGSPKKDEEVRNVPKTKSPIARSKERPKLEADGKENGETKQSKSEDIDRGGNVIQVSKHFSPAGRNWYAGPSVMWPPPVPYGVPLERYPPGYSRPLYPGSSVMHQEGFIQHIMGPTRNKFSANSKNDAPNKNLVSQERKFMVTNMTKYVLDFYCPHCGGEISVSKNRNRGGIFGSEQGAISINTVPRDPHELKTQRTTTPYPKETKTQHIN